EFDALDFGAAEQSYVQSFRLLAERYSGTEWEEYLRQFTTKVSDINPVATPYMKDLRTVMSLQIYREQASAITNNFIDIDL
ncbi:MAG: hypothetical protein ABI378_05335, partial [Chitinophagaceae bacterium]